MVSSGLERSRLEHHSSTFTAHSNRALQITKGIGTPECGEFRAQIFRRYPQFSLSLAHQYKQQSDKFDYCVANQNLRALDKSFKIHDLDLMAEEKNLHEFADKKSLQCVKLLADLGDVKHAAKACVKLLNKYQIYSPLINQTNFEEKLLLQVKSERWWLKQIRKKQLQLLDQTHRDLSLVTQHKQIYTSDYSVKERAAQKARNIEFLKSNYAVNSDGQRFDLYELAEHNISNPFVRRSEMMTRIKGFETVAQVLEHSCLFLTITAPSEKHANYKNSGKRIKAYDGSNPKEVNEFLCHEWKLIRSKLDRDGISFYGIRVVEPHHDGTPHWHILVFLEKGKKTQLLKTVSHYLRENLTKKSDLKYRLKVEDIDIVNRSAVGYIAKYVSKNIDGKHIDKDLYGKDAQDSATRIEAWASTWNIRQFQFVGGPSVTAWRELRRLRETITDSEIEPFRAAADSGDWAAYVFLMGGPIIKQSLRPLSLLKEMIGGSNDTKTIGVTTKSTRAITRLKNWVIKSALELRVLDGAGRAAEAVRPDSAGSWTCVNNCTHSYLELNSP